MPKNPFNFPKLKRLYRLSVYLNNHVGKPKTYGEIYRYMIRYGDADFCRSTLEKDIFKLRMDFDFEIDRVHNDGIGWAGICLNEPIDFMERLKSFFGMI